MKEVIELLNTAKNVHDWNYLRGIAKSMVSPNEISQIDGSGMCPQVIKHGAQYVFTEERGITKV